MPDLSILDAAIGAALFFAAAALGFVVNGGRWRWRKPPPPIYVRPGETFNLAPGQCAILEVETGPPPDDGLWIDPMPPGLPLGERLRRERAAVQARLDAAIAANDALSAARFRRRADALDRELMRFS